jgi:hypothetical protein
MKSLPNPDPVATAPGSDTDSRDNSFAFCAKPSMCIDRNLETAVVETRNAIDGIVKVDP